VKTRLGLKNPTSKNRKNPQSLDFSTSHCLTLHRSKLRIPSSRQFQRGDNKPRTADIGGEQIPIMTQAEVDQILTHKTDVSRFVITHGSTTPLDIWVTVGKDGAVKGVESASSGTPLNPDLENDLKQWKFKPFELNGEHVAVQTVIQLDGKEEKKNRD
jgi:hypothetical protein